MLTETHSSYAIGTAHAGTEVCLITNVCNAPTFVTKASVIAHTIPNTPSEYYFFFILVTLTTADAATVSTAELMLPKAEAGDYLVWKSLQTRDISLFYFQ